MKSWAWTLLLGVACLSAPVAHAAPGTPAPAPQAAATEPQYVDESDGRLLLWLEPAGVAWWATARAPLGDLAPWTSGLGFARDAGPARLAWRLHFARELPGDDAPVRFLMAEFVSFERVYRADAALRPWWRIGLGLGLDLKGDRLDLGTDGYFNPDNGPSAGLLLAHGWGVDAYLSARWFLRAEGTARAHVGAGRNGLLLSAHLGVGVAWDVVGDAPAPRARPAAPDGAPAP